MAYTVQCPSCSTEFPVDPAKVPEDGVNARCSSCAEVFLVEKPDASGEAAGGTAAAESPVEIPHEESTSFEAPAAEEEGPGFEEAEEAPGFAEMEEEPDLAEEAPGFEEPAAESPETAPPEFSSEAAAREDVEISEDDFILEQEALYGGEEVAPAADELEMETELEMEGGDGEPSLEEAPGDASTAEAEAPGGEAPAGLAGTGEAPTPSGPVQFGHRSPEEKAQRLARVLVSDMILYNPQRHTRAMEGGNLAEEFEDEIKKSWEEYVEQVGEDLAESTSHFTDALNEILAKGEEIF